MMTRQRFNDIGNCSAEAVFTRKPRLNALASTVIGVPGKARTVLASA